MITKNTEKSRYLELRCMSICECENQLLSLVQFSILTQGFNISPQYFFSRKNVLQQLYLYTPKIMSNILVLKILITLVFKVKPKSDLKDVVKVYKTIANKKEETKRLVREVLYNSTAQACIKLYQTPHKTVKAYWVKS